MLFFVILNKKKIVFLFVVRSFASAQTALMWVIFIVIEEL